MFRRESLACCCKCSRRPGEIIQHPDLLGCCACQQRINQMRADKAGAAGDQVSQ